VNANLSKRKKIVRWGVKCKRGEDLTKNKGQVSKIFPQMYEGGEEKRLA